MKTTKKAELKELGEDLAMFISQIIEAADGQGDLPSTWRLDDWMTRYRDFFKG